MSFLRYLWFMWFKLALLLANSLHCFIAIRRQMHLSNLWQQFIYILSVKKLILDICINSIEYLQYFFYGYLLVTLCSLCTISPWLSSWFHLVIWVNLVIWCFGNLLSGCTVCPGTRCIFFISCLAWILMQLIFSVANCRWKLHKFRDCIFPYCVFF